MKLLSRHAQSARPLSAADEESTAYPTAYLGRTR